MRFTDELIDMWKSVTIVRGAEKIHPAKTDAADRRRTFKRGHRGEQ